MSAGIQSVISIGLESTWGTAVVPNKSIAVRPTGGFKINPNKKLLPAIRGQLQKNYIVIPGNLALDGEYTMDLFGDYPGYFLLSAHGADTPALVASESLVYSHPFSEVLPKKSLTVEEAITENTRRYAGAICSGYKVSGKAGEVVDFSPKLFAKSQATSTAITPGFGTAPAYYHSQITVKIGNTTMTNCTSFELEYNSGIEAKYALGSVTAVANSVKGGSEAKGKIELYLDSASITRMTNFINNTNEALEIIMTGPALGNAANYLADFLLPVAVYTAVATPITDDVNLLSIDYDTIPNGSNQILVPTLQNLLVSYA